MNDKHKVDINEHVVDIDISDSVDIRDTILNKLSDFFTEQMGLIPKDEQMNTAFNLMLNLVGNHILSCSIDGKERLVKDMFVQALHEWLENALKNIYQYQH